MKNELTDNGMKRELGFFSATVLVIANMVGTGIFTTSGFIMAELKSPGLLLLCWLVGGLFALCGALCYGELGAKYPQAGGEYVFLRESFGRPVGFLSGWISLVVGFSAPIAAAAIAFSGYLFHACAISGSPEIMVSLPGVRIATIGPVNMVSAAVIILFSLIHYLGLSVGSRIQNGLTLFKTALIAVFIVAGFCFGKGTTAHFAPPGGGGEFSMEKFAISLIFISFAYSGWNASVYLGGEIDKPQRNIPLSLISGTLLVVVLYLLLNMLYIYAVPTPRMENVLDIGAKAASSLFGTGISRFFSGAISVGILSVLSAMIMTGPRIYYAMSKDGIFFEVFGKLDAKRRTPAWSICFQAGIAVIMVLTASFNALLVYIGFTLSVFAMMTVAGMMRLRVTKPDLNSTYKTIGYPFIPLVFILGNLWIIVFSLKSRPINSLLGLATIGTGILVYLYFVRHDKRKELLND